MIGKPAIDKRKKNKCYRDYYFSKDIWLPLKVNEKGNIPLDGYWLLSWNLTAAKYKGGKSMIQWIHTTYHFEANDKIDMVDQYIDKVAMNAALPPKR